jgi:hypothetical protein
MATYKIQVSTAVDTILPRDRVVNTFHLDDHGVTSDPSGLCEDTGDLFETLYSSSREIDVRAYDTGAAPNYPVGQHVRSVGLAGGATTRPREIALCLSYYGDRNLPRTRGRMFICAAACQNISIGANRPNNFAAEQLLVLADGIANLGGPDVDWVWWSTINGAHGPVKHSYVDDEWDTIRKRGLRPSTRWARTHNE